VQESVRDPQDLSRHQQHPMPSQHE